MLDDLRFGLRKLRQEPGFTAVAVLTLALGIGATAAIFSLIQGVLLTPPQYREPDRLVLIPSAAIEGQPQGQLRGWAAAQWTEWQREATSFDGIAAYAWGFNFLISDEGSRSIEGMHVSRDYFRVVGLEPVLGRTFLESEAAFQSATSVMVIGYDLWQRAFHADPNVIGRTVRISRRDAPATIVGVMPAGVRFLPSPRAAQEPNYNVDAPVDYWMPLAPNPERLDQPIWDVVGRLRSGVTVEQAEADLGGLAARQARADSDVEGMAPRVRLLTAEFTRDGQRILLPLAGAAALVLLIACGNVAALLLVRGLHRQDEYAVRSALGVSRLSLFRQVSTESLVLAIGGAAAGVALALGIVRVFQLTGGHAVPRLDAVDTGWPMLAAGLGLAIVAALAAGVFPAVRASRLDTIAVLKSAGPKSSTGRAERRVLRTVTIAQTAFTLALLVGAGLLIRTVVNLSNVDSGYRTDRIVTMTVTAVQGDWGDFHRRALERVAGVPGVEHAAFAWGVPLTGNSWPGAIEVEGQPPATRASERIAVPLRSVTPGYFALLDQTIIEGRDFRSSDTNGAPGVAIVNEAFAERYFPDRAAVGKRVWRGNRQQPPATIAGVVTNARTNDLTRTAEPEVYLSLWQAGAFSKDLILRTAADPRPVMTGIQRELRAVDPTVAVENVRTLEEVRAESVASQMFAMRLVVGFAIVATVLTLVGIYGVLSLSVAGRRREIAVRSAVGAQRRDIRNLVLSDAFRLIAAGVGSGILAAVILSRALRAFSVRCGTDRPGDDGERGRFLRLRRAAGVSDADAARGTSESVGSAEISIGSILSAPGRKLASARRVRLRDQLLACHHVHVFVVGPPDRRV
jgi:putative ABC transport system permease protein